ncbi:MAG TPA: ATP-binding protein [Acidimicrobiales bacterium]|nr:ATP-binding protein [Acidimicrobiales bacterium]
MRIELPADPTSAGLAREAVRTACKGLAVDLDSLMLCTSELVTNAVLHGRPPIELVVAVDGPGVRISVCDAGDGTVRRRRPVTADTLSGRGLDIVEALASAWGSDATRSGTGTGKVTWFEMRTA